MVLGSRWVVPAETEPVQRVWMSFPRAGAANFRAAWQLSSARRAWVRLAEDIHNHVPVTLLVDPDDQRTVASYVSKPLDVVVIPFNNASLRRTAATMVVSRQAQANSGRRRAACWAWWILRSTVLDSYPGSHMDWMTNCRAHCPNCCPEIGAGVSAICR